MKPVKDVHWYIVYIVDHFVHNVSKMMKIPIGRIHIIDSYIDCVYLNDMTTTCKSRALDLPQGQLGPGPGPGPEI